MTARTKLDQAAALAFELHMYLEDLLDDNGSQEPGVALVSEDDDREVGRAIDLAPGISDSEFLVKTADGTILRVTVEVAE